MKRTHDKDQWSQRRTEALLNLLKTRASPDFQTQVLARVRTLQQASEMRPIAGQELPGRWQEYRAWLQATVHGHPLTLATVAGSMSALLLIGSLLWWSSSSHGGNLAPAAEVAALAAAPQGEVPATAPRAEFDLIALDEAYGQRTVSPSISIDLITSRSEAPSSNEQETIKTTISQEQLVIPSVPLPSLQGPNKGPGVTPTQNQRFKKGGPSKSKRAKGTQGAGKSPAA
jgi:hypothetical protein